MTLVANPAVQTTEAVHIDASPSAVWPWLLRMVQSPVEHDGGTGTEERRQLDVGDAVQLAPAGWMDLPEGVAVTVAEVVPEKYLVVNASRSRPRWEAMWSFHLEPYLADQTRLLGRARIGLRHPGEVFAVELARPVIALSMRGLLLGVKQVVEQRRVTTPTEPHPALESAEGPSF